MLWIDVLQFDPPDSWRSRAALAAERLRNAQVAEARMVILKRLRLWSSLKKEMARLSNGKCWYCDSIQDRSDLAVDHYRPKGRLSDVSPPHSGYWWLAYEPSNFRLACTHCNSPSRNSHDEVRGKRSLFPLADESKRARDPSDALVAECPLLLDPTVATDGMLLFYDTDGYVRPNPHLCPDGSLQRRRAEVTIDLLNLNQVGIRDRRRKLARRMRRDFESARAAMDGFAVSDPAMSETFINSCEGLKECLSSSADLASNARSFVLVWKDESGIAEVLLRTVA